MEQEHPELGTILLRKRRGQKHIRLRIDDNGTIVVSMPSWVSYGAGLTFVNEKKGWITLQRMKMPKKSKTFEDETPIGKSHTLIYEGVETRTVRTRVTNRTVKVYIPDHLTPSSPEVIVKATKASERALLIQCEELIPMRLKALSEQYDLTYRSISFKKLKRRWGSCDSQKNIVINIYLMQLPWELIDYVLKHELAHTKHMHHQDDFWQEVRKLEPHYKMLRRTLKEHQTLVYTSNPLTV